MTINKYTGKTKEEAIAAAKQELGERIVIMSTKNRKPDGLLGIVKPSIWEVTVAVEEDTDGNVTMIKRDPITPLSTSTFSVAADEDIPFPTEEQLKPITPVAPIRAAQTTPVTTVTPPKSSESIPKSDLSNYGEDDLKSAFREISEVLTSSNIIKSDQIQKAPAEEKKENNKAPVEIQRAPQKKKHEGNLPVVRMVYNSLIENEVDEKYINQIFDDMGNILSSANSLDLMISNIYQKMVLKLGSPRTIELPAKGPMVVFFVGPTGVGKTTTIAKIASMFKLEYRKKVSFITADTYRIAATDQLSTYANILDVPISVIYGPEELNDAVEAFRDQDLILVDTVGFSHRNAEQRQATKDLLKALDSKYKKEHYLVLSVTTKYADLKEISDSYKDICDYRLIFTKLDETNAYGNILNIKLRSGADLSYITNGQNVPDDIDTIDSQKLVKTMLGGK